MKTIHITTLMLLKKGNTSRNIVVACQYQARLEHIVQGYINNNLDTIIN